MCGRVNEIDEFKILVQSYVCARGSDWSLISDFLFFLVLCLERNCASGAKILIWSTPWLNYEHPVNMLINHEIYGMQLHWNCASVKATNLEHMGFDINANQDPFSHLLSINRRMSLRMPKHGLAVCWRVVWRMMMNCCKFCKCKSIHTCTTKRPPSSPLSFWNSNSSVWMALRASWDAITTNAIINFVSDLSKSCDDAIFFQPLSMSTAVYMAFSNFCEAKNRNRLKSAKSVRFHAMCVFDRTHTHTHARTHARTHIWPDLTACSCLCRRSTCWMTFGTF